MAEQMMAAEAVSAQIAPPSRTRFLLLDGGLNQGSPGMQIRQGDLRAWNLNPRAFLYPTSLNRFPHALLRDPGNLPAT
jgi:hypothetical protein